ncbi:MAG: UMP kinase [Patescibacteria group bacterium]|nr:UMP kinase [Patescibacteria group bacterium]
MFSTKEPPIVISIGGSLIVPGENIDHNFLDKLNVFIREYVRRGKRFFLVAGGGKTSRKYQQAAKIALHNKISDADLDWLGIHATHLNGHLLRTIFSDIAHPRIILDYDKKLERWKEPVVIGAGWKPGWSTDYDAVMLARDYNANLIINLSNIDWVFDSDPRTNPNAKPIKKMTWEEMEKLVGTKWSPGINTPFDPIAAQLAKKLDLTVIIANGKNFTNLQNILDGEAFKGTVIMPYRIDASFYDREYYRGSKAGYRFIRRTSWIGRLLRYLVNWYRAILIKFFLNPQSVLDVGCGTGELVASLRKLGVDAYGVELSKEVMDIIEPSVKQFIRIGDPTARLPYKDAEFDLVVTYDVLEHIERAKLRKAIAEMVRVSKKYILHKIYTIENRYISIFHSKDFSRVSLFPRHYWQRLFHETDGVTILRNSFFRLPLFFETVFLLKKKGA